MSYLPVTPRARRIAISFASEPVTAKLTILRSPGIVPEMSSANSTSHGLEYQEDSCTSLSACSRIVSVSSGCECPSTMHIMPRRHVEVFVTVHVGEHDPAAAFEHDPRLVAPAEDVLPIARHQVVVTV